MKVTRTSSVSGVGPTSMSTVGPIQLDIPISPSPSPQLRDLDARATAIAHRPGRRDGDDALSDAQLKDSASPRSGR
jgi:hypothetical protein